jgi:hypothetical protein
MYSVFAGGVSRQTFISCETRGGITGNLFAAPLAVYLARLAVIDDQIVPGEMHLLRLVPQAWLTESHFENIPTEFGPVTMHLRRDGSTLHVTLQGAPKNVVIHTPPGIGRIERH